MNEEYLRFVIYKLNNRAEPTLMEHENNLLKGHFKNFKIRVQQITQFVSLNIS